MKRNERGFSLVELLVVIAIIAVLAGLLMPVLGRAKSKARQASCINNLRQLGIAISMYADANESRLPFAEPMPSNPVITNAPLPAISSILAEYILGQTNSFKCPEDRAGYFERERTSYEWFYKFNGKRIDELVISGPIKVGQDQFFIGEMKVEQVNAALLFDFENFHLPTASATNGTRSYKNALYADGHVGRLEPFVGSK